MIKAQRTDPLGLYIGVRGENREELPYSIKVIIMAGRD